MRRIFKGKGKAVAGSSSSAQEPTKRRRIEDNPTHQEEEEEEQIRQEEDLQIIAPTWDGGPLSALREELQPGFFVEKMNKLQNKKEGFLCEKEVPEKEFKPFGVVEKFKALGWEAALKCYDGSRSTLYMNEIEEWVSTLKLVVGSTPAKNKLVGTVQGTRVTMSFETLNRIAKFDTKSANRYQYPHLDDLYHQPENHTRWGEMLEALFIPGRNREKLHREDLKLKPKLLHLIMQHNVIPRRGDKSDVRYPEIPIMYCLMQGDPLVSYRYIVMNNIWLSRDSHKRQLVPHCRLITALLKGAGVITSETTGITKRFSPFNTKNLGSNWIFGQSDTHMVLKNAGQDRKWVVLKSGTENSGDETGSETERAEVGEDDDVEMENVIRRDIPGPSGGQTASEGITWVHQRTALPQDYRALGDNWAHEGSVDDVINRTRPHNYEIWQNSNQLAYDHITRVGVSHERAMKSMFDRQEQWNQAHAYAQQREINQRYEDDRVRRMHDQWHSGEEVISDPPRVDYTTLPPYDGSVSYPEPPLHHSEWLNSRPAQPQPPLNDQEMQDAGLDFGAFSDTFNSIFGPPHSRYY